MASVIYKNPPKSKKELKREEEIRQGQANIARMGAETTQEANREAEAFKRLAEQRLGNESQFLASERAQEELLRRRAGGEAIAAQRQMAGSLASQGIRGGAAQAARAAQANQGALMQSDIARQMIQGRGERQQGLRQQLLAAELAGKQFGLAKGQTTAAMKLADEAAKRGQFAQEGTSYLCGTFRELGFMSKKESFDLAEVFLGGFLYAPYTSYFYAINGNELKSRLKQFSSLDWSYLKKVFVDDVRALPTVKDRVIEYGEMSGMLFEFVGMRVPQEYYTPTVWSRVKAYWGILTTKGAIKEAIRLTKFYLKGIK